MKMSNKAAPIEQYMALALQPVMVGAKKNRCLGAPPLKHAENDEVVRAAVERMFARGIYKRPVK